MFIVFYILTCKLLKDLLIYYSQGIRCNVHGQIYEENDSFIESKPGGDVHHILRRHHQIFSSTDVQIDSLKSNNNIITAATALARATDDNKSRQELVKGSLLRFAFVLFFRLIKNWPCLSLAL